METIGQISPSDVLFTNREDYSGNAVYAVYLNESPVILRLYTPEGYVYRRSMNSGEWLYHYNLKDHSGSVRYTFQGDGTNIGYTHYYPSGVEFADPGSPGRLVDRRRFNDKELQTDFGLNWYDFVARGYDPAVGRPWQPDPLAENTPWISPYAWCANNPLGVIDPTGRDTVWVTRNNDVIGYIPGGDEVMIVNEPLPEIVVESPSTTASDVMKGTLSVAGILAVDDISGAGVADDPAIPFIIAGGAVIAGSMYLHDVIVKHPGPSASSSQYDPASNNSKKEKHGDGGRTGTKAEKQIKDLEDQKQGATHKEREDIDRRIRNIKRDAERKAKGEEHSRANKR